MTLYKNLEYHHKLERFRQLVLEENQKMNLISKSTENSIDTRHIQDSLQLLHYIKSEKIIVDLGSGSGFPGIILAIAKKDIKVFLCEKSNKKAIFLNKVKKELSLENVIIFNKNMQENFPNIKEESFLITARAFKSLKEILDLLALHNIFEKYLISLLLLKGKNIIIELDKAKMQYNFTHELNKSITNDGFVLKVKNIKKI
jgi:16S rRNA (guanine527-N7)-methyltransferase